MKFNHVIFDFDGVLADSMAVACEELNIISARTYPTIPEARGREDLARIYCGPLQTSLLRFGLTHGESQDFFDRHSRAMQHRASDVSPFDEVVKVVRDLPAQSCSIVTSSYGDAVEAILSKSGYFKEGLFAFISGRELHQPKSKKIADILSAVGAISGTTLHVGDTVSDLLYSRTVPIPFCAVGWGYHPLSYLQAFGPEFSVASPGELRRLLQDDSRNN